jgi:hypothetical protein
MGRRAERSRLSPHRHRSPGGTSEGPAGEGPAGRGERAQRAEAAERPGTERDAERSEAATRGGGARSGEQTDQLIEYGKVAMRFMRTPTGRQIQRSLFGVLRRR